jgi:hypothetical protein
MEMKRCITAAIVLEAALFAGDDVGAIRLWSYGNATHACRELSLLVQFIFW